MHAAQAVETFWPLLGLWCLVVWTAIRPDSGTGTGMGVDRYVVAGADAGMGMSMAAARSVLLPHFPPAINGDKNAGT